jgi:serine protein kinase
MASETTDIDTLLSTAHLSTGKAETMSIREYLEECKTNKMAFANVSERILDALGEPETIRTDLLGNDRKARIHQSKTIQVYPAFSEFFGVEDIVKQTVSFLQGHADGGEERNQVLYFMGPVGSGKTSFAEKLKDLVEVNPIYVLVANPEAYDDPDIFAKEIEGEEIHRMSPLLDSPLALFSKDIAANKEIREHIVEQYNIPERYFDTFRSPWATKRLQVAGGDINKAFRVMKIYPSEAEQIGIGKVEPKDTTNSDISDLVGKVDMNKVAEGLRQNDPDAYLYCGGFQKGNQGIVEFPEMFKAPRAALNPMLNGVQGSYDGTERVPTMPFRGLFIAHSNQSEWSSFKTDKKNEALLDRIRVIKTPYLLRSTEESQIYEKIRTNSQLADYPIAEGTVKLLADWIVASRLDEDEKFSRLTRVKVLDGEKPDGASSSIPTISVLLDSLPTSAGMEGLSTRFAMKVLQQTFRVNAADGEVAADPFLLKEVLKEEIKHMELPAEKASELASTLEELLVDYRKDLKVQILDAFAGASDDLYQGMFDRYIKMADAWLEDGETYTETIGGVKKVLSKEELNAKMQELERPADVSNPKNFRDEIVSFVHRQQSRTGEKVKWSAYEKMANVIRVKMSDSFKDLLPALKLDEAPANEDIGAQRSKFLGTMHEKGYTDGMISRALEECDFG